MGAKKIAQIYRNLFLIKMVNVLTKSSVSKFVQEWKGKYSQKKLSVFHERLFIINDYKGTGDEISDTGLSTAEI